MVILVDAVIDYILKCNVRGETIDQRINNQQIILKKLFL